MPAASLISSNPFWTARRLIVVGARPISDIPHFSPLKKQLQKLGSFVVQVASGTRIPDAPSGFRAVHRDAAIQLNVFNNYTYTLETIIQAGRKGIPITSVPVRVNGFLRPRGSSSSIPKYIWRSVITIVRIFAIYKPARFFGLLSAIAAIPAVFVIGRFLIFYMLGDGGGRLQSLIIGAGLLAVAAILAVAAVLADLIATNRLLLERTSAGARFWPACPVRNSDGAHPRRLENCPRGQWCGRRRRDGRAGRIRRSREYRRVRQGPSAYGRDGAGRRSTPLGNPARWHASTGAPTRARTGSPCPLPKSHYGFVPERLPVDGRPRVWQSQFPGRADQFFWGGTMMPLPDKRFRTLAGLARRSRSLLCADCGAGRHIRRSGRADPVAGQKPSPPTARPCSFTPRLPA